MKKIVFIFFLVLMIVLSMENVSAKEVDYFSDGEIQYLANDDFNNSCKALLGDPTRKDNVAYYLQMALDIMKYAGIVLCIVLTVVDFFKALLNDDKDMLQGLTKKGFKRLVYAVMLFFLPIIVKMFLTLIDVYGTCGIQ